MADSQAQMDSTARGYWDKPEELAYSRGVVGKRGNDDPAHTWYRLPSLDSFTAGCSCGWVSPERGMFGEMTRDVDRHLSEVRRAGTAPP